MPTFEDLLDTWDGETDRTQALSVPQANLSNPVAVHLQAPGLSGISVDRQYPQTISVDYRRTFAASGPTPPFRYPNQIGPGVYDIHSPRVPPAAEIRGLLEKAAAVLSPGQLWVNPDCGLKTREWKEVEPSLEAMVQAARELRERAGERQR